jgi:hypothetical protein
MAFSFSTAGSVPQKPNLSGAFLNMNPSTSAQKALNVAAGSFQPKAPSIPAAAPAPTNQPIKKQTVITASGDTHTTEYHPPTQSGVLQSAPQPQTFSGVFNNLANTSSQGSPVAGTAAKDLVTQPAGTPAAQGYTAKTAEYGAGNLPIGQQAKDILQKAGDEYARVGRLGANAEAGYGTTGTSPVAEGNAGVIARNTAEQQAAIEAGAQTALTGTGQELTGQNQAATAANEAAGTALTGQSNQIGAQTAAGNLGNTAQATQQSGLIGAGNLAQPQLGSIGQVPYSPVDLSQGSPLGAPGGTAADAAKVAGQFQGAQAAAAAPGQIQATNIQTAGTTPTKIAATGLGDVTQRYQDANASYGTIIQQAQNVQKILADTGINAQNSTDWNTAVNSLSARLGSANQSKYIAGLAELKQAYTQLLSSVGAATPTVNGQTATDIFNPGATPNQINAAIDTLNQAAYAKLLPMYQEGQTYQAALNSGGSSSQGSQQDPLGIR